MTVRSKKRKLVELIEGDAEEDLATNIKRLATGMNACMEQLASIKDMLADLANKVDGLGNQPTPLQQTLGGPRLGTARTKASNDKKEDFWFFHDDDEESIIDTKDRWTIMFRQLREFKIRTGHCNVRRKDNPQLGVWVNDQRKKYNNRKTGKERPIKPKRLFKLETLGFNWGRKYPPPPSWNGMFEQLHKHQQKTGNCNVPLDKTDPNALAKWVTYQRSEYKRFTKGRDTLLDKDQIKKLEDIKFQWEAPK